VGKNELLRNNLRGIDQGIESIDSQKAAKNQNLKEIENKNPWLYSTKC